MDAELKAKEDAKYNPADETMVLQWVSQVTGTTVGGPILETLKDGKVLVALANKLGGTSIKANDSAMPFKQMENISNFLKACRESLGMRENDLFTTADLYDGKSRLNVVNGLIATSRAASKKGYSGPSIAPKETTKTDVKHHEIGNPNASVSKLSEGSSQTMERSQVDISKNIAFGNQMSGGAGTADVSKLNLGSHGVMERMEGSKANDVDFGAKSGRS